MFFLPSTLGSLLRQRSLSMILHANLHHTALSVRRVTSDTQDFLLTNYMLMTTLGVDRPVLQVTTCDMISPFELQTQVLLNVEIKV